MHMIPQPEKTCHFPGRPILKNRHFARCWGEFFFFLKKTLRVSPAYSKEHGRDRDKFRTVTLRVLVGPGA